MSEGTGIAGAQDYVPTSTKPNGWVCVGCYKEFTVASAVVWVDKGLKQKCRACYEQPNHSPKISTNNILAENIVSFLQEQGGKVWEIDVCSKFQIKIDDIPWGYNIGFARCLGTDQKFYLISS